MEEWMRAHMHSILLGIEIIWVSGFLAVFVIYFLIKRWISKSKGRSDAL
ncbi:MAG: hypothetical protein FD130_1162 [Halothiobacillaceae bacterium]|nr:MAG: hypothetical protein FD130_1162 [Halothiobacillaceae bacterium]